MSTAQQSKTKRNLQILLSIDHGTGEAGSDFSVKIEGRLENGMGEQEILRDQNNQMHFLSYFEAVQVEFPSHPHHYLGVNWVKAKAAPSQSQADCIRVRRQFAGDGQPVTVKVTLVPENHPKKFKLSP